jgi:hypothetical protein
MGLTQHALLYREIFHRYILHHIRVLVGIVLPIEVLQRFQLFSVVHF